MGGGFSRTALSGSAKTRSERAEFFINDVGVCARKLKACAQVGRTLCRRRAFRRRIIYKPVVIAAAILLAMECMFCCRLRAKNPASVPCWTSIGAVGVLAWCVFG